MITLASTSQSRRALLTNAGLSITCVSPKVDEASVKSSLLAEGRSPRDIADALAELKALKISRQVPGFVIGADQTLDIDGDLVDKAETIDHLRSILQNLRGKPHLLHSAVVIADNGQVIWRVVKTARLVMRSFSQDWLERYLESSGRQVMSSVGGYHLEAEGAQLFSEIEGDYFTILGLPLIEVLNYLRTTGVLPS